MSGNLEDPLKANLLKANLLNWARSNASYTFIEQKVTKDGKKYTVLSGHGSKEIDKPDSKKPEKLEKADVATVLKIVKEQLAKKTRPPFTQPELKLILDKCCRLYNTTVTQKTQKLGGLFDKFLWGINKAALDWQFRGIKKIAQLSDITIEDSSVGQPQNPPVQAKPSPKASKPAVASEAMAAKPQEKEAPAKAEASVQSSQPVAVPAAKAAKAPEKVEPQKSKYQRIHDDISEVIRQDPKKFAEAKNGSEPMTSLAGKDDAQKVQIVVGLFGKHINAGGVRTPFSKDISKDTRYMDREVLLIHALLFPTAEECEQKIKEAIQRLQENEVTLKNGYFVVETDDGRKWGISGLVGMGIPLHFTQLDNELNPIREAIPEEKGQKASPEDKSIEIQDEELLHLIRQKTFDWDASSVITKDRKPSEK